MLKLSHSIKAFIICGILLSCADSTIIPEDSSSDGKSYNIMLHMVLNNRFAIGICKTDGSDLKILTDTSKIEGKRIVGNPVCSPDGKHIVYCYDDGEARQLIITDPEAKTRLVVPNFSPDDEEKPSWSPDSKYFVMNPTIGNNFSIINANGVTIRTFQLDSKVYVSDWLGWSPKGDLIAVRLNNDKIMLVSPVGDERTIIPIRTSFLSWNKEGDYLYFLDESVEKTISVKKYSISDESITEVYSESFEENYYIGYTQSFCNKFHIVISDRVKQIDLSDGLEQEFYFSNSLRFLNYNSANNKFLYVTGNNYEVHCFDPISSFDEIIADSCLTAYWNPVPK